jgi:phospholipid transport system substrate-binding protein
MKLKKLIYISIIYLLSFNNVCSIEPEKFVQITVDKVSTILSQNTSKEQKINELKKIAKKNVYIEKIGNYTLGSFKKTLNDKEKKEYFILFEQYFLKSFSSRLSEYNNPKIDVVSKKVLNKNYTMVNSVLKGTKERSEVKIDWRVYTKDSEKPLIVDLRIEGLSLARTQKEEFASILNSNDGNIKALFKRLKKFNKS